MWAQYYTKKNQIYDNASMSLPNSKIIKLSQNLTFWCRNFFILAHPVYKMWIIQEPNKLGLWNKLHFEERKKMESMHHV